jgi:hypothetical protein
MRRPPFSSSGIVATLCAAAASSSAFVVPPTALGRVSSSLAGSSGGDFLAHHAGGPIPALLFLLAEEEEVQQGVIASPLGVNDGSPIAVAVDFMTAASGVLFVTLIAGAVFLAYRDWDLKQRLGKLDLLVQQATRDNPKAFTGIQEGDPAAGNRLYRRQLKREGRELPGQSEQ